MKGRNGNCNYTDSPGGRGTAGARVEDAGAAVNFRQLAVLGLVVGVIATLAAGDIWVSITFVGVYGITVWVLKAVVDFFIVIGYKLQPPEPEVFNWEIEYLEEEREPRHPDPTRPGPDDHKVIDISRYRRKA